MEEDFVDQSENNYLLALDVHDDSLNTINSNQNDNAAQVSFACVDLSSGEFHMDACSQEDLPHKLAFLQPKEILLSPKFRERVPIDVSKVARDSLLTQEVDSAFRSELAIEYLANMFGIQEPNDALTRRKVTEYLLPKEVPLCSLKAAGALLHYVVRSHSGVLPLLDRPSRYDKDVMAIDFEAQKSLELTKSMRRGDRSGSLLKVLDGTVTSLGARLLASRMGTIGVGIMKMGNDNDGDLIGAPSASLAVISRQHDLVQLFYEQPSLTESLRSILAHHLRSDAARAIQNLKFNYGGPWHLGTILETFWGLERLQSLLQEHANKDPSLQEMTIRRIQVPKGLLQLLESVLPWTTVTSQGDAPLKQISELSRLLDRPGILRAESNKELMEAQHGLKLALDKKGALIRTLRDQCKWVEC